jgi:AraC family ethanolamine operon transcriptional activator
MSWFDPVRTSEIECADDLFALYDGTSVQIVPLSGDRISGRLTGTRFGESSLTIARFEGAFRTRGAQSGEVSVGIQIGVHGRVSQSGMDLQPGDVVVLPPDAERDGIAMGHAAFATATLSVETFNRIVRPGAAIAAHDRLLLPRHYRAPQAIRDLIIRQMGSLEGMLRKGPFPGPAGLSRAFERDLLLPFLVGIANDVSGRDDHPAGADARLIRQVEDWVDRSGSDDLNILDLCAALGVPLRTLQRAFARSLGIGPVRYLRLRRLARVRNMLIALGPGDTSVTRVAMMHGFWDLSRFAAQYRSLYGESPSDTLKTGRRRRPITAAAE